MKKSGKVSKRQNSGSFFSGTGTTVLAPRMEYKAKDPNNASTPYRWCVDHGKTFKHHAQLVHHFRAVQMHVAQQHKHGFFRFAFQSTQFHFFLLAVPATRQQQ
jgi:hypothetical protein